MKNIYLIKGNSYNLINEELAKITNNASNIDRFSLNDTPLNECLEAASYFGMFEEKKVILIKDTKYFGGKFNYENECQILSSFFDNMPEDVIIIFLCDDVKKTKDITKKAISCGAQIIEIKVPDEAMLIEMLTKYANENNIKVDNKALKVIIKNSVKNYDIALQELNKLSLLEEDITESVVSTYGSKEEDDYTFDFSNAVIAKNFERAFDLLDHLLNSGVDSYQLIGLLASSFTNMFMVKSAVKDNLTDDEIAKLFGYSSSGRVYILKKNSKIYTLDQLKEIILSLSDLDKKIKTGLNPVYGIKEFLLSL